MDNAVKVYHYRDHKHGGFFDGNCYVDTNMVTVGSSFWVRFKITPFDSGFQYIWGKGYGNNELSLKVVRWGGLIPSYYFRVTYLGQDYDFQDYTFRAVANKYQNVRVIITGNEIKLQYTKNEYGGFFDGISANTIKKDNISNLTYSEEEISLLIGASSYWLNGEDVVLDGNFISSENWEPYDGWSINTTDGYAIHTPGTASQLYQRDILTADQKYRYILNIEDRTTGYVKLSVGNQLGQICDDNGQFSEYLTPTSDNDDIMLQASSDFDGKCSLIAIYPVTREILDNKFTGRIYAFRSYYSDNEQILLFRENFLGNDINAIYDKLGTQNATIYQRPSNFWSSETEISSYFLEDTDALIKQRSDDYRTLEFSTFEFKLFNYFDIAKDDTIVVEINNNKCGYFSVETAKLTDNDRILEVECNNILYELSKMNVAPFLPYAYQRWFTTTLNSNPNCNSDYVSVLFILQNIIKIAEYDTLITNSYTGAIEDVNSHFYVISTGVWIKYSELCFKTAMFKNINKSDSDDYSENGIMADVFRQILLSTRLCYHFDNSILIFSKIEYGYVNIQNSLIKSTDDGETVDQSAFHQIKCSYLVDENGDFSFEKYLGEWDSEDTKEFALNNQTVDFSKTDSEIDSIELLPHFMIGGISYYTYENAGFDTNFLIQLSRILDIDLIRTVDYKYYTIDLSEVFSAKFLEKEDNLSERSTKIYQEQL